MPVSSPIIYFLPTAAIVVYLERFNFLNTKVMLIEEPEK